MPLGRGCAILKSSAPGGRIAAEFARDRRRRPHELPCDEANTGSLSVKQRNLLPLGERQKTFRLWCQADRGHTEDRQDKWVPRSAIGYCLWMASERSRTRRMAVPAMLALVVVLGWWWFADESADSQAGNAIVETTANTGHSWSKDRGRIDQSAIVRDRTAIISGTITDEQGAPIPDPTVCIWPSFGESSWTEAREPTCVTGARNGTYQIAGLMPVHCDVTAGAPTFVPDTYDPPGMASGVELRSGEHRQGVDIQLQGGAVKVAGTVQDVSGGVIEGALVSGGQSGASSVARLRSGVIALSDGDGKFELWVAPGFTAVTAVADGYTAGRDLGPAPGRFFEIVLTPESVLVGRVVVAGTGAPVEGARVYSNGDWNRRSANDTFSDAQGRFRIDRLLPGEYKPVAEAEDGFGMAAVTVGLGLAQTSEEVVIEMHPAGSVEGSVVYGKSGVPCEEGWVLLSNKADGLERSSLSNRDGVVRFIGLLPGTFSVSVDCFGAASTAEYPDVVVAGEPIAGLTWAVDETEAILGIVVRPDGTGVRGVRLTAFLKGDKAGALSGARAQSEKDGTFELRGLQPGTYAVSVSRAGPQRDYPEPKEEVEVEVVRGVDTRDVRIELLEGGKIIGRVVDERGEGVASAMVHATGKETRSGKNSLTADDGSFTILGLIPGRYRVFASKGSDHEMRAPGQSDDDVKGSYVDVDAGEEVEVELVVEDDGGVIDGQVIDEGGGPIEDAFISVKREAESAGAGKGRARRRVGSRRWGRGSTPVLSDADGRFEVTGLSPGKYTVEAARRGGGEAVIEHVELGADVVLRVESDATVAGTVTLAGGGFPDRFQVLLRDKQTGSRASESFFQSDGAFTLAVPAGNYELTASAAQGTGKVENLQLSEAEVLTSIKVEIQGLGTVKGRLVTYEEGTPLRGRIVLANTAGQAIRMSPADLDPGQHISNANGEFVVERVPAGRVRVIAAPAPLNVEKDEYDMLAMTTDVKAGEVTDLGVLSVPKLQVKRGEKPGDLGFTLADGDPTKDRDERPLVVALVRPGGPAAAKGLKSGDVIIAVNGQSVEGSKRYLYGGLTSVKEGTTVTLGLKQGHAVSLTAVAPM